MGRQKHRGWCFCLFFWNCRNKYIVFALISNIIRNTLRDFMWKCSRKFGSKNVEFLTSRMFASSMNPCLSKFGALRECSNVEETRNPMQTFGWKKYSHFSQTNFHLHFHLKSHDVVFFLIILLINPKRSMLVVAIP